MNLCSCSHCSISQPFFLSILHPSSPRGSKSLTKWLASFLPGTYQGCFLSGVHFLYHADCTTKYPLFNCQGGLGSTSRAQTGTIYSSVALISLRWSVGSWTSANKEQKTPLGGTRQAWVPGNPADGAALVIGKRAGNSPVAGFLLRMVAGLCRDVILSSPPCQTKALGIQLAQSPTPSFLLLIPQPTCPLGRSQGWSQPVPPPSLGEDDPL